MINFDVNKLNIQSSNNIEDNNNNNQVTNSSISNFDVNNISPGYQPHSLLHARNVGDKSFSIDQELIKDFEEKGFNYTPGQNVQDILFNNQSNWEKLGNALGQAVVNEIIFGTFKGFTDIGGGIVELIGRAFGSKDADYNNELSSTLDSWQKAYEESHPIYTDPNRNITNGGLTDFAWWMSNLPSIMSSVGLLIPSTAIVKGVGSLGKITKVSSFGRKTLYGTSKLINKATRGAISTRSAYSGLKTSAALTANATLQRFAENYQEAQQTYQDMSIYATQKLNNMSPKEYQDYLNKNKDLVAQAAEDGIDANNRNSLAKYIATKSADKTFATDWSNLVFDVIEMHALHNVWKGISQVGNQSATSSRYWKDLQKYVGKNSKEIENIKASRTWYEKLGEKSANLGKGLIKSSWGNLSEGAEEAINYIAQQEGMTYGKILLGDEVDKGFSNRLRSYYNSPELYDSAFWGVLGGVVFQGLGSGMARINTAVKKKYSELNNKERNTDSFTDYFDLTDNKRNRTATNKIADDFAVTVDKLKDINNGKDPIHSTPNVEVRLDEKDKENAKKKVFSDFVTRRTKDAIESGNIEDLRNFLNSEQVKNYFIEQGIITKEESDSLISNINQIINNTEKNYNDQFERIFTLSQQLNKIKDEKNPFKGGLPIEFIQILVNDEFSLDTNINDLQERIDKNQRNLTTEDGEFSFRSKFRKAVENSTTLNKEEKENLLNSDLYDIVDTYLSYSAISQNKKQIHDILYDKDGNKRKNISEAEQEIINTLENEIDDINNYLNDSRPIGYHTLVSTAFDYINFFEKDSKDYQALQKLYAGLPLSDDNDLFNKQLEYAKEGIFKLINDKEISGKAKELIYGIYDTIFTNSNNFIKSVMNDYKRTLDPYNTFMKLYETLEKAGLENILQNDESKLFSDTISSFTQLVRDKFELRKLKSDRINSYTDLYRKALDLHKDIELSKNSAIKKAYKTIRQIYEKYYNESENFKDYFSDLIHDQSINIEDYVKSISSKDASMFNDSFDIIFLTYNNGRDVLKVFETVQNIINQVDANKFKEKLKQSIEEQENSTINENLENEQQNSDNIIIPQPQQNSTDGTIMPENQNLDTDDTTSQQSQNDNSNIDDNNTANNIARQIAAYKFKNEPCFVINRYDVDKTRTEYYNNDIIAYQSQTEKNVFMIDVQANINISDYFDNIPDDFYSNPEKYVVDQKPIANISDGRVISLIYGTLREINEGEQPQFNVPISKDATKLIDLEKDITITPNSIDTSIDSNMSYKQEQQETTNNNEEEVKNENLVGIETEEVKDTEEQKKLNKDSKKFLKDNLDNNTINKDNFVSELTNYLLSKGYTQEFIDENNQILIDNFNLYKIKTRNKNNLEELNSIINDINTVKNSNIITTPITRNSKPFISITNILNHFVKKFKCVKTNVDDKTKIYINTEQLFNYIKTLTNEETAYYLSKAIESYFTKEYDNTKYELTSEKFININNKKSKTNNSKISTDVNLSNIPIINLQGLKAGDKISFNITTNNNIYKVLELKHRDKIIGTITIPNMKPDGTYEGLVDGLIIPISKSPNTNTIQSEVYSILVDAFSSTGELNNFVSLLTQYTYENDAKIKEEIFNKLVDTEVFNKLLNFKYKKATNKDITNGLSKILKYINYEESNNINLDNIINNSLYNWFEKLYNSYEELNKINDKSTITIDKVSEGEIIRTTKLNLPNEVVNLSIENSNTMMFTVPERTCDGSYVPYSPLHKVQTRNRINYGNTGVLIANRNGTYDYVDVYPASCWDVIQRSDEGKKIFQEVVSILTNDINNFINKKITIDELYNKISEILPSANNRNSIFSRINISYNNKGNITINFDIEKRNLLNDCINYRIYINKNGTISSNKQGNNITHSLDIKSIQDLVSDAMKYAQFDINYNLLRAINEGNNYGIISTSRDGKFHINIGNYSKTYDSYNDFLLKNQLYLIKLGKDTQTGSNYRQTSTNQAANQILKVNIKNSTPVEGNEQVSTIAITKSDELINTIYSIIKNPKITDKGTNIVYSYLRAKGISKKNVDNFISKLKMFNLIPSNIDIDLSKEGNMEINIDNNSKDYGKVTLCKDFIEIINDELNPDVTTESFEFLKKLIHEQLHFKLNQPNNKKYIAQVENIYDIFAESLNKDENAKKLYSQYLFNDNEFYPTKLDKVEEFLIESLTTQDNNSKVASLARYLNSINIEGEIINNDEPSLLQKIMSLLADIFGFNINENSLYAKEFNALRDLFDTTQIENREVKTEERKENKTPEQISSITGETISEDLLDAFESLKHSTTRVNITSEMQEIKDKAMDNGSFMKAPNGQHSNLNEEQWLQVRTKAFKNWFGDWTKQFVVYQGKTNDKDNRKYNYYTIDKKESSKYGNNIETKIIDTTDFLNANSKEYENLYREFHNNTKKWFDILNNTPEGLQIQNEFFDFVKSKGYKGLSILTNHPGLYQDYIENPYIVTFDNYDESKSNISKIVDENGEPLIVYHGTNINNITIFDRNKGKDHGTYSVTNRVGSFFIDDKNEAESYASVTWLQNKKVGEPTIYDVFLNITNPLYFNTIYDFRQYMGSDIEYNENGDPISKVIINEKYDGVIVKQVNKTILAKEFVIRNSNQVKSATNNNGEFNKIDNNIKHSTTRSNIIFNENTYSNTILLSTLKKEDSFNKLMNITEEKLDEVIDSSIKRDNIKNADEVKQEIKNKYRKIKELNINFEDINKVIALNIIKSNNLQNSQINIIEEIRKLCNTKEDETAVLHYGTYKNNSDLISRIIPYFDEKEYDKVLKGYQVTPNVLKAINILIKNFKNINDYSTMNTIGKLVNSNISILPNSNTFKLYDILYTNINDNTNITINTPKEIVKDSKNYIVSYYNNVPNKENNIIFADKNIINNSNNIDEIKFEINRIIKEAKNNPDKYYIIESDKTDILKYINTLFENVTDNVVVSKTWIDSGYFNNISKDIYNQAKVIKLGNDLNIETIFTNENSLLRQFDNLATISKIQSLMRKAAISIKC